METTTRNGKNGEKANGKNSGNGHLLEATQAAMASGPLEALVAKFAPAALALLPEQVVPFRGDGSAVYHNVTRGVESVLAERHRIGAELRTVDVERFPELSELGLAITWATLQVDRARSVPEGVAEKRREAGQLRELMLTAAEVLAKKKVVPAEEVARIRKGKGGAIKVARNCLALADFFRRHAAAVKGKSPVTQDDIQRAEVLGTELLKVLKSKSVPKTVQAPAETAERDLRDRLYTLLLRRYDEIRRIGFWLFGETFSQRVPQLTSVAHRRKKKGETPDSPGPAPANEPPPTA